jgi:signal transduction histidine kinase
VNDKGRVDTIAVSDPGWEACSMPKPDAIALLQNLEIRGIRGKIVKEQQSLIFNDPTADPDWIEPPAGHPKVTSFLGVPLKRQGRTTGIIGLANKPGGYTITDREDIELLSVAFVEALLRKRNEEVIVTQRDELQSINRELKETQKEVEFFNDLLSHDIRNYTNVASGDVQLILEGKIATIPDELRESMEIVKKQMNRISKLVEDVMMLSHLRRLNEATFQSIDLHHVLSSSLDWARSIISGRPLRIIYNGEAGRYVNADPALFTVLVNLLDNSIKHNSGNEILLEISVDEELYDKRPYWRVAIADNGDGITDSYKDKIFNRYERRSKQSGVGLGLTLVKAAVDRFNGFIRVTDRVPGNHHDGAKFILLLPKAFPPE